MLIRLFGLDGEWVCLPTKTLFVRLCQVDWSDDGILSPFLLTIHVVLCYMDIPPSPVPLVGLGNWTLDREAHVIVPVFRESRWRPVHFWSLSFGDAMMPRGLARGHTFSLLLLVGFVI